jgi:hypothetical protein
MRRLCLGRPVRLEFLWEADHVVGAAEKSRSESGDAMPDTSTNRDRLERLSDRIRNADSITPDLWTAATAPMQASNTSAQIARQIARQVAAFAWTDAALSLLEAALPDWSARRILHEDAEWLCGLSCRPSFPLEFDQMAEGRHADLGLAILAAIVEAHLSELSATPAAVSPSSCPDLGTVLDAADYA